MGSRISTIWSFAYEDEAAAGTATATVAGT
jgi:hypothetical protein